MEVAVVGSSGQVGRQVVASLVFLRQLAKSDIIEGDEKGVLFDFSKIEKIRCVNRRDVPMKWYEDSVAKSAGMNKWKLAGFNFKKDELSSLIDLKQVDFETVDADAFKGCSVVVCCLGTTRKTAGSAENFTKIDYGHTMACVKAAKACEGVKGFIVVTASSSNKDSWFLYNKVKGDIEEGVKGAGFAYAGIVRPSLLLCERDESRPAEFGLQKISRGLDMGNWISIRTEDVAFSCVAAAMRCMMQQQGAESKLVERIEMKQMVKENGILDARIARKQTAMKQQASGCC